jgi:hypothetical protein
MRGFNFVSTPRLHNGHRRVSRWVKHSRKLKLSYLQPTNVSVKTHGMITSHFVVWRLNTGTTLRLFYFSQAQDKKMEKEEENNKQKNSQKDIRSSNSRRLR